MELSSSRMYTSPSFNKDIAHIADRVVNELRNQNDEDVFTFSEEEEEEEEEEEFEFPVSTDDDQIPLRYPVFDRTLLSPVTESKPPRPSLKQLLNEDRHPEDLNGVAPGTKKEPPRGKHKKSSSVSVDNILKRWKVRDLLKRSYSDDNNYTNTTGKESPVVVFLPPISLNEEKLVNKVVKSDKVEKNIPAYKTKKKIGNIRIPNHYHFRQATTNLYRY